MPWRSAGRRWVIAQPPSFPCRPRRCRGSFDFVCEGEYLQYLSCTGLSLRPSELFVDFVVRLRPESLASCQHLRQLFQARLGGRAKSIDDLTVDPSMGRPQPVALGDCPTSVVGGVVGSARRVSKGTARNDPGACPDDAWTNCTRRPRALSPRPADHRIPLNARARRAAWFPPRTRRRTVCRTLRRPPASTRSEAASFR